MRTQHVKLLLPTPAIVLLVLLKALKLQNVSIVEVYPKKFCPGLLHWALCPRFSSFLCKCCESHFTLECFAKSVMPNS